VSTTITITATTAAQWHSPSYFENNWFDFGNGYHLGWFPWDSCAIFPVVTVPKNSTITRAILQNVGGAELTGTTCKALVYGNDVDNATLPVDYASAVALVTTSAVLTLNNIPEWSASPTVNTIGDVKDIVQEIVNRSGWVSGNSLQIITNDNGSDERAFRQAVVATSTLSLVITFSSPSGWTGTIGGVTNPAAVGGLDVVDITSIGGIL
jgi:hypothetical protein